MMCTIYNLKENISLFKSSCNTAATWWNCENIMNLLVNFWVSGFQIITCWIFTVYLKLLPATSRLLNIALIHMCKLCFIKCFKSAAITTTFFFKYFCCMFVHWYLKTIDFFSHLQCWCMAVQVKIASFVICAFRLFTQVTKCSKK